MPFHITLYSTFIIMNLYFDLGLLCKRKYYQFHMVHNTHFVMKKLTKNATRIVVCQFSEIVSLPNFLFEQ